MNKLWIGLVLGLTVNLLAWAGPPFVTDDPDPVEFQHWEVYLSSLATHDSGGWTGTAPHIEVNYGAAPNLQVHVIAPVMTFSAPSHAASHWGYGDTELGAKYRFIDETNYCPQVGVFPLVELPSGDPNRGLGSGEFQGFLPLWLQKSFGPWTTYGGGGYWINPGTDNRKWWFVGWQIQRQVTSNLVLGAEVFHETQKERHGESDTKLNVGGIFDFNETFHLLFSGGPVIQGPSGFQTYLGFQITFGPGKPSAPSNL